MAEGEAERNNLKGKYQAIVVLLDAARNRIQEIFDHLDDEGDRVYLGSTNHRDWLRDMLDHMDRWSFDAILPKRDINKMEGGPYAEIFAQRARAEAAEAELDSQTRALDEAETGVRRLCASSKLLDISQRLIKWDTDFPVNCWNGYAGLKELDKIIADAKVAVHQAGASYDDEFGTNHPPAKEGHSDER
ncbi:hypothetical protein BTN45_09120 [Rhizobium sp. ZX09]|nr:hypothetical protein BTN45_09120 [Rhizobium sp. ZX09]